MGATASKPGLGGLCVRAAPVHCEGEEYEPVYQQLTYIFEPVCNSNLHQHRSEELLQFIMRNWPGGPEPDGIRSKPNLHTPVRISTGCARLEARLQTPAPKKAPGPEVINHGKLPLMPPPLPRWLLLL